MKALLNYPLITQTTLDSAALTMLGAIVRRFPEPGDYRGTVYRGDERVGHFHLSVDEKSPATQVNIDLATANQPAEECECKGDKRQTFVVNPKGYVVFHVSRGPGGFSVTISQSLGERGRKVFDSQELREGDLFTATLIRPGVYSVTNVNAKTMGEIIVAYPQRGKERYRPPDPISIECGERGFNPYRIEVRAAQSQVYRIMTPSRIRIELEKPDDGPGGPREPKVARWRKPGATKGKYERFDERAAYESKKGM